MWLMVPQVRGCGDEERFLGVVGQDQPVVALDIEGECILAVGRRGNKTRQPVPGRVLGRGFAVQNHDQHLCGRKQPQRDLPELVLANRAGLQQLDVQLLVLGKLGEHHLDSRPRPLLLDQPGLTGVDHLQRHADHGNRQKLETAVVVFIVRPQLERDGAPVVWFQVRQHVERSDLRPEELVPRPRGVLLELLLEGLGIGQDLQPLLLR